MQEGLEKLLSKQAIRLMDPPPTDEAFYSTLFLVPKKDGGWRPILNLKLLNKHIKPQHFRMDTLKVVLRSIGESLLSHQMLHQHEGGDSLLDPHGVSIDLEDAYFHIAVLPADRKYLRFAYDGKVYEFQVLPFGLSTAPRTFTRVVRAIAAFLKTRGVNMFQYLDDWYILGLTVERTELSRDLALQWTRDLGFLINIEKSDLFPKTLTSFIGSLLSLLDQRAIPSQARMDNVIRLANKFLNTPSLPAREWRGLLGHLASLFDLVPFGRARARPIQLNLRAHWSQTRDSDDKLVPVLPKIKWYLRWWADRDNLSAGVPFLPPSPTATIVTDASMEGWGGHFGESVVSGVWDTVQHINVLELRAVWLTLEEFLPALRGATVEVFSDNTTTVAYINKEGGTHSRQLCLLALKLLDWCQHQGISLVASHIAGVSNVLADALSRGDHHHPTEWMLNRKVAQQIFLRYGKPWIDLFASGKNNQLPTFYSILPSRLSSGTNALTQDWSNLWGYAYPPIAIIPRVLNKLLQNPSAQILLVAPFWPSQIWFRNLTDLLTDWPRLLPPSPMLLKNSATGMLFPKPETLRLTVWPLSGNPSLRQAFQRELPLRPLKPEELQLQGFTMPVCNATTNGAYREIWIPLRPL